MTETTPTPPAATPPLPPNAGAMVNDERQMALVVYILYLVPVGVTHVIGVILAYVAREAAPDWLKSHYTFQIRTFWIGLLYFVVACCLCVILIGFLLLPVVYVWFVVRSALGLSRLVRTEPYPTPENWLI
jgi:uncharacterized membrane protein